MKHVELTLNLIAIKTIVMREIRRFMRIKIQTVLPSMITTALYYLIFGNLIGQRIGEMRNIPYTQYIMPGLLLMAIISNSYANSISSFFSAKFQRHLEEMLISPVSAHSIVIGYTLGGICRGMVVGIGVYLVSLYFTNPVPDNIVACFLLVFTSAMFFSLAGLLNGIFAKTFDDTTFVSTFILVPLIYLGGVFYAVDLLPPFWRALSFLNPILYLVEGLRHAFLGTSVMHWAYGMLAAVGMSSVLYLVCVRLIQIGVPMRR